MADITLGTLRDYWKRVSDWLQGNVTDKPAVTLYGSDDGGTTKRLVKTDSDGAVQVDVESIAAGANIIGQVGIDQTTHGTTNKVAPSGPAAENAAVAGNPVLVGGRYDASDRTLDDGDVGGLALNSNGHAKVELNGSFATIDSAPVVGAKTVSTTAAELFAGASRLANRYAMVVYNESSVPVYWGPSGVTAGNGFTLLPQDSIVFQFNPAVATAIYFVAGSNAGVRVVELA